MSRAIKGLLKVINAIIILVLLLILTMNVYMIIAKNVLNIQFPSFFGYSNAVVVTGSMANSIEVDDMVIIHKQNKYSVGDIISFKGKNSLVTHRIVGTNVNGFITKGDANNSIDIETVPQASIIGKVVLVIPKAGKLTGYFS